MALCAGNSMVTGEFPWKGQWRELWCFRWSVPWINGWENIREAGDSRRHRAHNDVIVMINFDPMYIGDANLWNYMLEDAIQLNGAWLSAGPVLTWKLHNVIIKKNWSNFVFHNQTTLSKWPDFISRDNVVLYELKLCSAGLVIFSSPYLIVYVYSVAIYLVSSVICLFHY